MNFNEFQKGILRRRTEGERDFRCQKEIVLKDRNSTFVILIINDFHIQLLCNAYIALERREAKLTNAKSAATKINQISTVYTHLCETRNKFCHLRNDGKSFAAY